jgi:hypothetical protein
MSLWPFSSYNYVTSNVPNIEKDSPTAQNQQYTSSIPAVYQHHAVRPGGLTTLAMVLNSLRIDPMRTWKGAWRWYNEQNLACCFGPDASAA